MPGHGSMGNNGQRRRHWHPGSRRPAPAMIGVPPAVRQPWQSCIDRLILSTTGHPASGCGCRPDTGRAAVSSLGDAAGRPTLHWGMRSTIQLRGAGRRLG